MMEGLEHWKDGRLEDWENNFRPVFHHSSVPFFHLPSSRSFREPKPQQTGTGLLNRLGEVATTSGSTIFSRAARKNAAPARRGEIR